MYLVSFNLINTDYNKVPINCLLSMAGKTDSMKLRAFSDGKDAYLLKTSKEFYRKSQGLTFWRKHGI